MLVTVRPSPLGTVTMIFRIGPLEVFIDSAPQFLFFEFHHIEHDPSNREAWAMGLHFVISRV